MLEIHPLMALRAPPVEVLVPAIIFVFLIVGGALLTLRKERAKDRSAPKDTEIDEDSRERVNVPAGLAALRRVDPHFSRVLFMDLCTLLFQRCQTARGGGRLDDVAPYLGRGGRTFLARCLPERVDEVIVGSATLTRMAVGEKGVQAWVVFEACLTEYDGGQETRFFLNQRWTLTRQTGLSSLPPETITRLGCPSCGSAEERTTEGRCPACKRILTDGKAGWAVTTIEERLRTTVPAIERKLGGGGKEFGTEHPTIMHPAVLIERQKLASRSPGFTWEGFEARVRHIFLTLQQAWSTLDWEKARVLETETLFQSHRFWIDRYRREKLRNVLADVALHRIEVCRVEQDPFYDVVTTRISASMLDTTVTLTGEVVGGDAREPRVFTEYWTFVRRTGVPEALDRTMARCPSCGAPIEVNAAGACTFCKTQVASGEFDWVLSSIEQDEAFFG
jgi:hypothetical protein